MPKFLARTPGRWSSTRWTRLLRKVGVGVGAQGAPEGDVSCLQESEAWRDLLDWRCRSGVICTQAKVKAPARMPHLGETKGSSRHGRRRRIMRRRLRRNTERYRWKPTEKMR